MSKTTPVLRRDNYLSSWDDENDGGFVCQSWIRQNFFVPKDTEIRLEFSTRSLKESVEIACLLKARSEWWSKGWIIKYGKAGSKQARGDVYPTLQEFLKKSFSFKQGVVKTLYVRVILEN